ELAGQVVIIGRGQPRTSRNISGMNANDQFKVPTESKAVPGVYVQAAAAYTLIDAPLYRFTHLGRILADVFAALIPLGIVLGFRLSRAHLAKNSEDDRLFRVLAWTVSAVIFVIGYFWVNLTGILWTDYLMVIAALLLHAPLEHFWKRAKRLPLSISTGTERGE